MKCEAARKLLSAHLDGELADELRPEVEAHLVCCAGCRTALDDWARIGLASVDVLSQAVPETPLRLTPKLTRRLRRAAFPPRSPLLWGWVAAAGLMVATIGGVWYSSRVTTPTRGPRESPAAAVPAPTLTPALEPPPPPEPKAARRDPPRPHDGPEPAIPSAPDSPAPAAPRETPRPELPGPLPDERAPKKEGAPSSSTVIALARLEQVEGEVFVASGNGTPGQDLVAGQSLRVGKASRALVKYPDGTTIEMGAETTTGPLDAADGKRVEVIQGIVSAHVAKQPAGKPMKFVTAHAESVVLGTRLKLRVDSAATNLEVTEGKVRVKSTFDRKSVDLSAGQYILAEAGKALRAMPIPKVEAVLKFDFEEGKLPEGWDGIIEPAPKRVGNRFSVAATVVSGSGADRERGVWLERRGLFWYSEGMELQFDYWLKEGSNRIRFSIWDQTQRKSLDLIVPAVADGTWRQATVRLEDFREAGTGVQLKPGDEVVNVRFYAGHAKTGIFYIDNVQVVRPRR